LQRYDFYTKKYNKQTKTLYIKYFQYLCIVQTECCLLWLADNQLGEQVIIDKSLGGL